MAISVYGVSPSIGEAEWAILHQIEARGGWHEVVDAAADFAVTAGGGTRQLNVAGGSMAVCGTLVQSSGSLSVNSGANAAGNPRIDQLVLQIDWSGTTATAGTLQVVAGTPAASPVAATLTRVAGTMWQVKLAEITVTPGQTAFTNAQIRSCVPQRRGPAVYKAATITSATITAAQGDEEITAAITVADPGWPYKIAVSGRYSFGQIAAGRTNLRITLDDVTFAQSSAGAANDSDAIVPAEWSVADLTGVHVVKTIASPSGGSSGTASVAGPGTSVIRIPA
jgi:hypothetical protein